MWVRVNDLTEDFYLNSQKNYNFYNSDLNLRHSLYFNQADDEKIFRIKLYSPKNGIIQIKCNFRSEIITEKFFDIFQNAKISNIIDKSLKTEICIISDSMEDITCFMELLSVFEPSIRNINEKIINDVRYLLNPNIFVPTSETDNEHNLFSCSLF